jgi:tellurite methyltransferase
MINITEEKLKIMMQVKAVKTVLDIGCGNGFMSDYFLNQDCKVTGLDLHNHPSFLGKKNFTFIQQDIRDYKFTESFDLNICSFMLHFFKWGGGIKLIDEMKKATNPGGYNLLVCFSNYDALFKDNLENFFPSPLQLTQLYSDWDIVNMSSGESEKEDHGGKEKEHTHHVFFALFKKPDNLEGGCYDARRKD